MQDPVSPDRRGWKSAACASAEVSKLGVPVEFPGLVPGASVETGSLQLHLRACRGI